MGQVVGCWFCKNKVQALISGYKAFQGVPKSSTDLYRGQTKKQTKRESVHY